MLGGLGPLTVLVSVLSLLPQEPCNDSDAGPGPTPMETSEASASSDLLRMDLEHSLIEFRGFRGCLFEIRGVGHS